jgi:helicase
VRLASEKMGAEPEADKMQMEDLFQAAAQALFARGLSAAAHAFLAGKPEEIADSVRLLGEAEQSYVNLGRAAAANLSRLFRSLVPVMWQRSTWVQLREHLNNPMWRRYLKLLARGTGRRIVGSSSISELWPSQLEAVRAGLLGSEESYVVRMPTSAGKTRVAELAIVDALLREVGAKCVYVAPFRALVSEVEQTFGGLLSDLGFRVSTVLGTFESDDFERLLVEDADLVVLTPEKLDLFLRLRSDFLANVRLIVLDEGHLVHDLNRGAKYELLLTRLKVVLVSPRFLVLSAVVPEQTLQDFAKWLGATEHGIIRSPWRPSVQRIAALVWRRTTGVLRYAKDEHAVPGEFVPGIIRQRLYEFINPVTRRLNRRTFPEDQAKSQIAAELAFEFANVGSVLVFATLPRNALAIGKALGRRLELMQLTGEVIPPYFATPQTRSAQVAGEWLGDDHPVTQLLRVGIAVHHGQLPDAVRSAIEADCRERHYRVLAATSTLAQGVNLPIRTVVFHSCWRGDGETQERISGREYWNIAGRAGRAGEETEGTVIHLILKERDEGDYNFFLRARNAIEPVESALFQALNEIRAQRLTEAALGESLDAEVLAMAVEEVQGAAVSVLDKVLGESLLAVQAKRAGLTVEPIRRALFARRDRILRDVPDSQVLQTYSATGLRSESCENFRKHVLDNSGVLRDLLRSGGQDYDRLTDLLLDAAVEIYEMTPVADYPGDRRALLGAWISGSPIDELRREYAPVAVGVEDLTKFIEDFFVYRLPWGFAGYLRIAARVLDVEEIGSGSRFFPSMVKFGVPFPEAAWAMAAGMPLRRVAISLADDFLRTAVGHGHEDFLAWLGRVEIEPLQRQHALTGPILEDVSRALRKVGRNSLLAAQQDLTDLLPLNVNLRGVSYGNRRIVARRLTIGQVVALDRDYDNMIDQNAVRVTWHSQELGYLPRETAQILAPEVDTGLVVEAVVVSIADAEIPSVVIRISSPDTGSR